MVQHTPEYARWEKLYKKIGIIESDIIHGSGSYSPTSPEYKDVNILSVAAQMEDSIGIPDLQMGSVRMLGMFDADASIIWVPVHAYLPVMMRLSAAHHLLISTGEFPLMRGAVLTRRQEAMLGIPEIHPGDLERIQKENDIIHARLERQLSNLEGD